MENIIFINYYLYTHIKQKKIVLFQNKYDNGILYMVDFEKIFCMLTGPDLDLIRL